MLCHSFVVMRILFEALTFQVTSYLVLSQELDGPQEN